MTSLLTSSATEADYFLDVSNMRRLYIVYTLRCNYECAHCIVSSNPRRREKMAVEDAERIVAAAATVGYDVIYLTGGEVLLYYKDVMRILRKIQDSGMYSVVETNGSWAVDEHRTVKRLGQLVEAGLDCIAVSMDRYHEPFGGTEFCLRIAKHSARLGLPCRVLVVASEDRKADELILQQLTDGGVRYFYEELLSVGRGAAISMGHGLLQTKRCDSIGATVLTNGDLISCAGALRGTQARKDLPLYSGNLINEDCGSVLSRDRNNVIAAAIDEHGHKHLVDLVKGDLGHLIPKPDPEKSICDFCHRMLEQKILVEALRSRLAQASAAVGYRDS